MKDTTIQQWVDHFLTKYPTKEDLNIDLDRIILECKTDESMKHQLGFYKRIKNKLNKSCN